LVIRLSPGVRRQYIARGLKIDNLTISNRRRASLRSIDERRRRLARDETIYDPSHYALRAGARQNATCARGSSMSSPRRSAGLSFIVRTIGMVRTRVKIGQANLAYSFSGLALLNRPTGPT